MSNYLRADVIEFPEMDGSTSFAGPRWDLTPYSKVWFWLEYTSDASAGDIIRFNAYGDPDSLKLIPITTTAGNGSYVVNCGVDSPTGVSTGVAITDSTHTCFVSSAKAVWLYMPDPPPYFSISYARAGGTRRFKPTIFGRSA